MATSPSMRSESGYSLQGTPASKASASFEVTSSPAQAPSTYVPKYRKRSRAPAPGVCHSCGNSDTPEWRRGPGGARTLCNACGLHFAKLVRRRTMEYANAAPGVPIPPVTIAELRQSTNVGASSPGSAPADSERHRLGPGEALTPSRLPQGSAAWPHDAGDAPPPPPPAPSHLGAMRPSDGHAPGNEAVGANHAAVAGVPAPSSAPSVP